MQSLAIEAYNAFVTATKTIPVATAARRVDPTVIVNRDENGVCYEFHDGSYLVTAGRGRAHRCLIISRGHILQPQRHPRSTT